MVAMEIIVTMATERVINTSQYKVAAVSYLIINISAILRPKRLKFGLNMRLQPNSATAEFSTLVIYASVNSKHQHPPPG